MKYASIASLFALAWLAASPAAGGLYAAGDVIYLPAGQPSEIPIDRLLANDELSDGEWDFQLLSGPAQLQLENASTLRYDPGAASHGMFDFTYRVEVGELAAEARGILFLVPAWQPFSWNLRPGADGTEPPDGWGITGIGWYRHEDRTFLRCELRDGDLNACVFHTAPASVGTGIRLPMAGDWDGDGDEEPALYDPETGVLHTLEDSASCQCLVATAEQHLNLGASERPLHASWAVRTSPTFAAYDLIDGTFTGAPSSGSPLETELATPTQLAVPLVADWNSDGLPTLGLWDHALAEVHYLVGSNNVGVESFLATESGGIAFTGRWGSAPTSPSFLGFYFPAEGKIRVHILSNIGRPSLHVKIPVDPDGGGDGGSNG